MELINTLYYLLALAEDENEQNRFAHSEEYKNLFYKLEDALIKAEIGENKAKAFDIINEKRVDMNILHWAYPSCKAYNVAIKELKNTLFSKELTPDEFEFLGRLAGAE